ncbi:outer membrane protein, partial [Novosphingobium nitrogenifigens]
MRKLVLGLALATTAMATPAFARSGQWYVEVEGGASILETENKATTTGHDGTLEHNTGWTVNGQLGYDFGMFRLEGQVGYLDAGNKTLNVDNQTITAVGGRTHGWKSMLNGLVDFGPDNGLQGYVGGGLGVARIRQTIPNDDYMIYQSRTKFAWQLIAGVRAPISKHWDIGARYEFFNVDGLNYAGLGNQWTGTNVHSRLRTHNIMGTLTYNFGGKTEEAAPPPPPPAPPPPP